MKSLHGVNCLLMTPFTERGTIVCHSLNVLDEPLETCTEQLMLRSTRELSQWNL